MAGGLKTKIRNTLARVKARKAQIAYSIVLAVLSAVFIGMIATQYSSKNANLIKAEENKQLVVFDLESGEKTSIAQIIDPTKKPVEKKPDPTATAIPELKPGKVSFIISQLGDNPSVVEKAISLPNTFILSFSPYAEQSLELSRNAGADGHTILLDLPVEMENPADAKGNLTLMIENSQFKNLRNFNAALSKVYEPTGILTPENDTFTRSNNFVPLLQEISGRKLFLAYGGNSEDVDGKAKENDVNLVKVALFIDGSTNLEKQLAELEDIAHRAGYAAVVLKNATSESLLTIEKWSQGLAEKKITLVTSAE